jgi:hypothetical protein
MLTNKQVLELIKNREKVRTAYDIELAKYTRKHCDFPVDDDKIQFLSVCAFMSVLKTDDVEASISEVYNYFSIIDRM